MQHSIFIERVNVPLFTGKATALQTAGLRAVIDRGELERTPREQLAYMLATAYHETSGHMQPVIETRQPGEKKNPSVDTAIARLEKAFKDGKLSWVKTPYWRKDEAGKTWLGRGFVQITHKPNYKKLSGPCGVDLVADPDAALTMSVALSILFEGMTHGIFTGRALGDYIDGTKADYRGARRVINGQESADKVAHYAVIFEAALMAAGYAPTGHGVATAKPVTPDVATVDAVAPKPAAPAASAASVDPEKLDKPISKSKTFWMWLTTAAATPLAAFGGLDWRVQLAIVAVVILFAVYAIKRRADIAKVYRDLKDEISA
ncbi:hypothetical protein [Rhizobium sp. SGZ-381]|uniref:hypothetical protein n=1 Tax=Rhizobium sp. SGZ-381 TaxID=3342800 RepID=UPI00366A9E77